MARKGAWSSIAGNPFARKMWFARLRAAGRFKNSCKKSKGACKNKTKGESTLLSTNEFGNVGPRDGKAKFGKLIKKGKENAKKGLFTDSKEAQAARVATTKNVRQRKQSGENVKKAKFQSNKTDSRVVANDKTTKVRRNAAVGVRKSVAKAGQSARNKNLAASTNELRGRERAGKTKSSQQYALSSKFRAQETGSITPRAKRKK